MGGPGFRDCAPHATHRDPDRCGRRNQWICMCSAQPLRVSRQRSGFGARTDVQTPRALAPCVLAGWSLTGRLRGQRGTAWPRVCLRVKVGRSGFRRGPPHSVAIWGLGDASRSSRAAPSGPVRPRVASVFGAQRPSGAGNEGPRGRVCVQGFRLGGWGSGGDISPVWWFWV